MAATTTHESLQVEQTAPPSRSSLQLEKSSLPQNSPTVSVLAPVLVSRIADELELPNVLPNRSKRPREDDEQGQSTGGSASQEVQEVDQRKRKKKKAKGKA